MQLWRTDSRGLPALPSFQISAESQTLDTTTTTTTTDVPTLTPSNSVPEPTLLLWFDPSIRPAAYHCVPDRILGLNCGIRTIVVEEEAFPHVVFT